MKTTPADLAAAAAQARKKRASQKDDSRQWHPSVLEFEDGDPFFNPNFARTEASFMPA